MLQIRELKSKLNEENTESNNLSVKEEIVMPETENKTLVEEGKPPPAVVTSSVAVSEADQEVLNYGRVASIFVDFKDGSSDSDSSAILNEDNSPNVTISHHSLLMSPASSSLKSSPCLQFSKASTYQSQFVKTEEHNLFGKEACNFFSDDQPPSLQWYCSEPWS